MKPDRLDADPHTPDAGKVFKFWLKSFELFLETLQEERQARQSPTSSSANASVPEALKLRLLLTSLSPAVFEYVEDAQTYESAVEILEKTYKKQKNPVFARHLLATRGQRPDESLAEYVQALKILAKDCAFKDVSAAENRESLIRDSFINGLASNSIRQRLLEHAELDLQKAMDLANSLDMAQKQSAIYSSTKTLASASEPRNTEELKPARPRVVEELKPARAPVGEASLAAVPSLKKNSGDSRKLCFFCGGVWDHARIDCPAIDKICLTCGIKGHYARVCRKGKNPRLKQNQPDSASAAFLASAVTKDPPVSLSIATLPVVIKGIETKALLDSGASQNFIDVQFARSLGLKFSDSSEKHFNGFYIF